MNLPFQKTFLFTLLKLSKLNKTSFYNFYFHNQYKKSSETKIFGKI